MKKLGALAAAIITTTGIVWGQPTPHVHSRPAVPDKDVLNRLNLKLAWKTYLPVDGGRDGLATVQVMGDRIYVQLYSGYVLALNAETGQTLWRTRVGQAYKVSVGVGTNWGSVFTVNGHRLVVLDKATGQLQYDFELPNTPTAAPVADAERVYVCMNGPRLIAYELPLPDDDAANPNQLKLPAKQGEPIKGPVAPEPAAPSTKQGTSAESTVTSPLGGGRQSLVHYSPLSSATKTMQELSRGFELPVSWDYGPESRMDFAPVVSVRKPENPGFLVIPTANGALYGSVKVRKLLNYSFQLSPVSAPIGQYGDIAYLALNDSSLIAMNIDTGRLLWRLAAGGTTRTLPNVSDEDVYIAPDRVGLYRINRATGEAIWNNPKAIRYLGSNKKFVYAMDRTNQLLVLDRNRGTTLTTFDTRDFIVPVSNDYSDRIYLAANDGLLICLNDRDYATSLATKQFIEEKKPEGPKRPAEKAPAEKKEDK